MAKVKVSQAVFAAAIGATQIRESFDFLADKVRATFEPHKHGPLFRVVPGPLCAGWFNVFLSQFSPEQQQHHNCRCCERFLNIYGGLVTVTPSGRLKSVLWNPEGVPDDYIMPVTALQKAVESAAHIEAVHLSSDARWGSSPTESEKHHRVWTHFCLEDVPVFKNILLTASQAAAEKTQDVILLERAVVQYNRNVVVKAKHLLDNEHLYRGHVAAGIAEWFLKLHDSLAEVKLKAHKRNLLWLAAATAPAGWAHLGNTMIGTLLDDLKLGVSIESAKQRFDEKMHPLQYRRSQSLPSAGNVREAERVITKLQGPDGMSLRRKFATMADVVTLWKPRRPGVDIGVTGIFGGVATKQKPMEKEATVMPQGENMTWVKFAEKVLPQAVHIDFWAPHSGSYVALVTAADMTAPPMLQWDYQDARNPVSWYLYHRGSKATDFGIEAGWTEVSGLCRLPNMWNHEKPVTQHGDGVIVLLRGCEDKRTRGPQGGGVFTEDLRSEYHGIRSTLEEYFRTAEILPSGGETAAGYDLRKGNRWPLFGSSMLRVTTAQGIQQVYCLDRWD